MPLSVSLKTPSQDTFICVLALDEGIYALRNAILDAFESYNPEMNLECSGYGHRYSSQKASEELEKTKEGKRANQFSIWAGGKCLPCRTRMMDDHSEEDYLDAVPEF